MNLIEILNKNGIMRLYGATDAFNKLPNIISAEDNEILEKLAQDAIDDEDDNEKAQALDNFREEMLEKYLVCVVDEEDNEIYVNKLQTYTYEEAYDVVVESLPNFVKEAMESEEHDDYDGIEALWDNMIENGIYESFEEIDTDERIFIRKLK